VEDAGSTLPARDGRDLALSIDRDIQHIAASHLQAALDRHKAQAAAIVVLDVQSGEVLALANLPHYDPNDRRVLNGAQLRNRVLTDTYEPGSVMKPFTIALALERGLATPDTPVDTAPGHLTIGRATIRDASRHGTLSVAEVLQKSSNVGTVKLALRMPAQDMWSLLTKAGFGQAPQLGFPGSAAGTAPRAQVPGYRVAGKTSTAHKPVAGRYTNRYIAGFVGFAPVSAPRIIVAVMIDEPTEGGYFGGRVAAPVFAAVTRDTLRALEVAPDAPVADIIVPVEQVTQAP